MIVDYPDSLPALDDLQKCLEHTHQHDETVLSLSRSIDARLLHPGADTANILQIYVSAIKALRHLDPSGVTLEAISQRVATYLKARPDTIRQIVTSLTDPESAAELLEGEGGEGEEAGAIEDGGGEGDWWTDPDDSKLTDAEMLAWNPDPVRTSPYRRASPHPSPTPPRLPRCGCGTRARCAARGALPAVRRPVGPLRGASGHTAGPAFSGASRPEAVRRAAHGGRALDPSQRTRRALSLRTAGTFT